MWLRWGWFSLAAVQFDGLREEVAAGSRRRDAGPVLLVWLCRSYFWAVIDCNLHNDGCLWPCAVGGIQWPHVKNRSPPPPPPSGSQAHNGLHPSHVHLKEYCACFSIAQPWHAVFCCRCHLVILTARTQGGEYWCEPVYPSLSMYVSNPGVVLAVEERTSVGGHPLHMHE